MTVTKSGSCARTSSEELSTQAPRMRATAVERISHLSINMGPPVGVR
jgi:hypothetical protein